MVHLEVQKMNCVKKNVLQMEEIMTKAQLLKKIAYLESLNDQLSTEVTYVDQLMRMVGFSYGLEGIKATAQEMIAKGYAISENADNNLL